MAPPPVFFCSYLLSFGFVRIIFYESNVPPSHIAIVPSTSITGTSLIRDSEILLCLFEFCFRSEGCERASVSRAGDR